MGDVSNSGLRNSEGEIDEGRRGERENNSVPRWFDQPVILSQVFENFTSAELGILAQVSRAWRAEVMRRRRVGVAVRVTCGPPPNADLSFPQILDRESCIRFMRRHFLERFVHFENLWLPPGNSLQEIFGESLFEGFPELRRLVVESCDDGIIQLAAEMTRMSPKIQELSFFRMPWEQNLLEMTEIIVALEQAHGLLRFACQTVVQRNELGPILDALLRGSGQTIQRLWIGPTPINTDEVLLKITRFPSLCWLTLDTMLTSSQVFNLSLYSSKTISHLEIFVFWEDFNLLAKFENLQLLRVVFALNHRSANELLPDDDVNPQDYPPPRLPLESPSIDNEWRRIPLQEIDVSIVFVRILVNPNPVLSFIARRFKGSKLKRLFIAVSRQPIAPFDVGVEQVLEAFDDLRFLRIVTEEAMTMSLQWFQSAPSSLDHLELTGFEFFANNEDDDSLDNEATETHLRKLVPQVENIKVNDDEYKEFLDNFFEPGRKEWEEIWFRS